MAVRGQIVNCPETKPMSGYLTSQKTMSILIEVLKGMITTLMVCRNVKFIFSKVKDDMRRPEVYM